MKRSKKIASLVVTALMLSAFASGCVELSRTEKMTTYSGDGKAVREIPGHESQSVPQQQQFPSK